MPNNRSQAFDLWHAQTRELLIFGATRGMTVPALIGIASVLPPPTFAQGENVENPNIPRTADGKPNLAAPTPRAPDGKPDLSEKDIQHLGDRS
jgi:hypothetical protein